MFVFKLYFHFLINWQGYGRKWGWASLTVLDWRRQITYILPFYLTFIFHFFYVYEFSSHDNSVKSNGIWIHFLKLVKYHDNYKTKFQQKQPNEMERPSNFPSILFFILVQK